MGALTPGTREPTCATSADVEALNQTCYCMGIDADALRHRLEIDLEKHGLAAEMLQTHPHLFAAQPVFISRDQVQGMTAVIHAVEAATGLPGYVRAALAWAPETARFDPGTRGGLLGFDFHLSDAGPQLIEINTNPGGALLNVMLADAQKACCGAVSDLVIAPSAVADRAQAMFNVLAAEWRMRHGAQVLRTVAIVDVEPERQYLYPEFLLYRSLLERNGLVAIICDPRELQRVGGALRWQGRPVDLVYNRLTDFSLEGPALRALKAAYLTGEVVVSPHPRAHALYADKRNLTLLCDKDALLALGAGDGVIATLTAGIPRTETVTTANRDAMWTRRRELFFKPAAGYGSKAAYRGDKLTKRVWAAMTASTYVAQALVAPSQRQTGSLAAPTALKVDVRQYAYAGTPLLVAARLYQGQTTNFRTPGGGFAPVMTMSIPEALTV